MAFNFASGQVNSHEAHLPQLVNALVDADTANEYVLLLRRDNVRSFPSPSDRVKHIVFPCVCRHKIIQIFCEQAVVPVLLLLLRIDLLHFPTNVRPLFMPCRTVGTIHWVLTPLLLNAFSLPKRLYSSFFEGMSLKKADRLIAVSADCKAGLVANGVSTEKVEVIRHGIAQTYRRPADPQLLERYGLRAGYLLYVGNSAEYKNLPGLLAAYSQARARYGIEDQLVLVGAVDSAVVSKCCAEIGDGEWVNDVVCTGYVPYTVVPVFYAGARLFLSLSLQETFGVVLLEAMASGVPMVISAIPAYAEVAGGAAIPVDPANAAEAADAIGRITADDELRAALIERGLARTKEFGWQQAAVDTLRVYEAAMGILPAIASASEGYQP